MGRTIWITTALAAALAALVGTLFVIQNSARTTQLSLDLYVAAWQLEEPVSVMALLGIGVGVGFVLGVAATLPRGRRLRKKIRNLENQVALGGDTASWK